MSHLIRPTDLLDLQGFGPAQPSKEVARRTSNAVGNVLGNSLVSGASLEVGAHLTHTALVNATLLAKAEEACIQMAPLGEQRYKAICDAYTLLAVQAIGRLR